jgi:hypothetical protein
MLTGKIFKGFILVFGTSLPKIGQELNNRVFSNARHSYRSPDGIPFD